MYDPEPGPASDVLAAVNEVPKAFFRLAAIGEPLLAEFGVTPPERGVLRDLFLDGEATAPDLARRKPVTRQSIQPVLDGLAAKGLVRTFENPRHKRSMLYALTREGVELCVAIQARELAVIGDLLDGMAADDFAAAARALKAINARLEEKIALRD